MDPVTLIGVVASSLQIAQFIGTTIHNLHTLKGKFQDADVTIRLVIGQLSTIKAAIIQIHEWAEFNFDDSPKEKAFMDGLNVALDGCKAAMDVLSEEVDDLIVGTETAAGTVPTTLGIRARVKAVWSEDSMKAHQDRLYGQVQALQLLLTAGQCWDAMSQSKLLGLKENQKIIQKVVDDTKTLRESQSSVGSQGTHSVRSSTTGTAFDFDTSLRETDLYRTAAFRRNIAQNNSLVRPTSRRPRSSRPANEGGQQTGTPQPEHRTADLSRNPSSNSGLDTRAFPSHTRRRSDFDNVNIYRSGSITATSTASEPAIHRWLSSSSSTSSPPIELDSSEIRKKNFWASRLKRLNTFSASKLTPQTQRTQSAGAAFPAGQRRRRNQEKNTTQSIDFTSADELETPPLIRVAQAGNVVEIQRLLDNGENIEAYHIPTQRTALAVAAHCGNSEVVRLLMRFEAKLNTRDYQSFTPLHLASSRGHCKVMELLLSNDDIDVEAMDQNKQTALWVAADRGHLKAVDILLKQGAKINARANEQMTPLHTAARQGDKDMIELLLRNKGHIEARDNNSMTALHHACETGHDHVVDFLLQKGANIESTGKDKKTPLIFAAASGQCQVVTLLSKRRASSKSVDKEKANALHWSASGGHLEVVEYLLDWKLSLHDTDLKGLTPLHLAVIGLHFAVVDFLLRKDASVDSLCREGWSPLHYACMVDNSDIVRLLLSAGAKIETQVPADGRRPVHIAAANGCLEILQVLLENGASIAERDSAGNRPLCIACHQGHVEVVEKLLEYGEPLRMPFKTRPSEDSPLCIASRAGHFDIVRLLIRKGASVKQRDEFGYIPLRYAAYYGHPDVLQLLLEEGAELIDDGEDSHGWGFVLMPDMIGFSEDTNISEDRRRRVRELLEGAERNIDRWNRDDNPDLAYNPQSDAERSGVRQILGYQGNPMLSQELHGSGYRREKSELAEAYRTSELPGQHQYRGFNIPTTATIPPIPQYPPPPPPSLARSNIGEDRQAQEHLLQPPSYSSAVSPMNTPFHAETQRSSGMTPRYAAFSYGERSSIPEDVTTSERTHFVPADIHELPTMAELG